MTAMPQSMRFFSPLQSAAAVSGEWNRILQPMILSADSVAKVQPYFSSSRQAFMYSALSWFPVQILESASTSSPAAPTKPSNMLRLASTSTAFSPQAQPISSPRKLRGMEMPRLTSPSVTCPS